MLFKDQERRIRRFLRDPKAKIWGRQLIIDVFNDIQKDMQSRVGLLEDVAVLRVPPQHAVTYTYDWEWGYAGASDPVQVFHYHEPSGYAVTSNFEIDIVSGLQADTEARGAAFSQSWEAWYLEPGKPIHIPFPNNFHSVNLLAYDQKPVDYESKKNITMRDSSYMIHQGEPRWYYIEDALNNSFVPYPRPSSVVWNDEVTQTDPDYLYVYDFEKGLLDGMGGAWLAENDDNFHYVFDWERSIDATSSPNRGMWLFEFGFSAGDIVLYIEGDQTDGLGTFAQRADTYFNQDEGATLEALDDSQNFLLVYDITPKDIVLSTDESDFPVFLRKYIEYGVLERLYGANTDGRIRSLSQYWRFRYETGIQMIKKFKNSRKADRDYQLKTADTPAQRTRRHPRLPDSYPAVRP